MESTHYNEFWTADDDAVLTAYEERFNNESNLSGSRILYKNRYDMWVPIREVALSPVFEDMHRRGIAPVKANPFEFARILDSVKVFLIEELTGSAVTADGKIRDLSQYASRFEETALRSLTKNQKADLAMYILVRKAAEDAAVARRLVEDLTAPKEDASAESKEDTPDDAEESNEAPKSTKRAPKRK